MFDRIERIRQSFIPRKTEQSDTRDQIKRHDPDYKKHHDLPKQDDDDNDYTDLTDITVESLIIFLEGLKKNTLNGQRPTDDKPVDQSMKPAIDAYGKGYQKPESRFTYLDEDDQHYDIDMVNDLIARLFLLKNDGIEHITLIQAEGFLESINTTLNKLTY